MAVGVLVLLRHKADNILKHGLCCRLCNLRHRHKPLHRELWLNSHASTLRVAYVVCIWLGLLHKASSLQVLLNLLAALKAVYTDIHAYLVVDSTVVVEDVDGLKAELLAQHIVVYVVCRGYLQRTSTELNIYILVADNRNRTTYKRNNYASTLRDVCIAWVVWIEADCSIAQNGLWTGCSNDNVAVCALKLVAQVVELTLRLLIYYLLVRKCGLCAWIPVYHTHTTVDLALVVEVAEDTNNALCACLVHSKACAVPVARSTELTKLLEDNTTVLLLPLPSVCEELLTGKRRLVNALSLELCYNLSLSSNTCVVSTRHPASVLAKHTRTTHKHILKRVVEHVTHVEHTSYVWRRNNNCKRLALIWLRVEKVVVHPIVVPLLFNLLRRVFVCDLHSLYVLLF